MQLKVFIVPVKNLLAAEAEMNAFLRGHRVLAVKKEFVSDAENSFWTFCVEHLESGSMVAGVFGGSSRPKIDYKEELEPEEFLLFSRLREWRKGVADREAVPVYTVLSNGQLAEIVRKKVNSKAGLKEVAGVGEARVEKYGDGVLKVLGVDPTTVVATP